jgi:hypothetical protein
VTAVRSGVAIRRGIVARATAAALISAATIIARTTAAQSNAPAIHVVRSHQVSTAHPSRPHVESFLAVDPRDSKHMIAASMVGLPTGQLGTSVYVTFDGGREWSASRIAPRDSVLERGGDPIVYITRDGGALYALGGRVNGRPATVVSRSADGGRTWGSPQPINYRDRPYMAFDTVSIRLDGTIYVGGQFGVFLLSRSADDGRSFSYPEIISRDLGGPDRDAPIRGLLADLLVTADGVLVMPFAGAVDMRDSTAAPPASDTTSQTLALRLLISDDAGRSFFAVRDGPRMHAIGGFRGAQATSGPRAAIDQSRGRYRGRIYLVFPDWDAERKTYVVRLAHSSDLGKTWKTTVVNEIVDGHDPGNPALAVTRDGIVGVVWNDRRGDPKNQCWRLYGAVSTDGGETFLPNVALSVTPTCMNAPANWVLNAWYQYDYWTKPEQPRPGFGVAAFVASRFPNGGDTQGLVADAEGVFHAAWINGETGTLQLWYTAFAVDSQLVAGVRARNAERTVAAGAAPVPAGRTELTQELTFEVSEPKIDFDRGALEVTVRVVNPTGHPVRGPIDVVVDRLTTESDRAMGLENFKAANADNGKDGEGAAWTFAVGAAGVLAPNGKTPPRVLRFSFTGGVPQQPIGYFVPLFRIFGQESGAR